MDELRTMVIRDACRHLLMQYATAVDREDMDMETYVNVFADEFVWKRPGTAPMRNHADIREFFRRVHASRKAENRHGYMHRHNLTTVCIDPIDEHTAKGIAYALVYTDPKYTGSFPSPMSQPELVVEYRDLFKKTAKGWKIVEHEAIHVFRSDWAFVGLQDPPPIR